MIRHVNQMNRKGENNPCNSTPFLRSTTLALATSIKKRSSSSTFCERRVASSQQWPKELPALCPSKQCKKQSTCIKTIPFFVENDTAKKSLVFIMGIPQQNLTNMI